MFHTILPYSWLFYGTTHFPEYPWICVPKFVDTQYSASVSIYKNVDYIKRAYKFNRCACTHIFYLCISFSICFPCFTSTNTMLSSFHIFRFSKAREEKDDRSQIELLDRRWSSLFSLLFLVWFHQCLIWYFCLLLHLYIFFGCTIINTTYFDTCLQRSSNFLKGCRTWDWVRERKKEE